MNDNESTVLVGECGAGIAIPTNFGLFNGHGEDENAFVRILREISPSTNAPLLESGKGVDI